MKAIVLCAGRGTRLGDLTRGRPKALLSVGGRPLIVHTLEWLAAQGVTDVLINLHYLPEAIPEAVAGSADCGVRVHYAREERLLGTAGTVRENRAWIGDKNVLVVYGDIITDQTLGPMIAKHSDDDADATLLVHSRVGSNSVVTLDEHGRITAFTERPDHKDLVPVNSWVFSGVQVLNPRLVARIAGDAPLDLPRDIYAPLVNELALYGFPLSGRRVAVDSPSRLEEATILFGSG